MIDSPPTTDVVLEGFLRRPVIDQAFPSNHDRSPSALASPTQNLAEAYSSNVLLIAMWYSSSIIAAKLNYVLLEYLGSAIALSLFQQIFVLFAGSAILLASRSIGGLTAVKELPKRSIRIQFGFVIPLGFAMTCMSVAYNSAMSYIPVSFLNTIKATIPFWTCIVCWLLYKQKFSLLTKISLIPIVGGVAIASATELGFHPLGFLLGLISAFNQTFFNLHAKSILIQQIVTPMQLQVFTAGISSMFLGVIYSISMVSFLSDIGGRTAESPIYDGVLHPIILFALGGLNYFAELRLSYAVIAVLGSLGYSIADVFRRLIIICSSFILFGNPVQLFNIIGVCIAMFGILMYNLSVASGASKGNTYVKEKVEPPIHHSSITINTASV